MKNEVCEPKLRMKMFRGELLLRLGREMSAAIEADGYDPNAADIRVVLEDGHIRIGPLKALRSDEELLAEIPAALREQMVLRGILRPSRVKRSNPYHGNRKSELAMPSFRGWVSPLFAFLAEQDGPVLGRDTARLVAMRAGLNSGQMAVLLPSGKQPLFVNRIGWALDALKRCRYAQSVNRGWWCLTAEGRSLAAKFPDGLPEEQIKWIGDAGKRNTEAIRQKGAQVDNA